MVIQSDLYKHIGYFLLMIVMLMFYQCKSKKNIELKASQVLLSKVHEYSADSIPLLAKETPIVSGMEAPSVLEVPNPERNFPMTYLKLYGSSVFPIGQFQLEEGTQDSLLFSVYESSYKHSSDGVLDIYLTKEGDGWKLTRNGVYLLKEGQSTESYFPIAGGLKLVGANENTTWIVGSNEAFLINNKLEKIASYPWNGGLYTIGNKDAIFVLVKDKKSIMRLDKDGGRAKIDVSVDLGPFEKLIGYQEGLFLTIESSTFRYYGPEGLIKEIPVQSCGLLSNGDPFFSYTKDKETILATGSSVKQWDIQTSLSSPILPVVGDRGKYFIGYHIGVYGLFPKSEASIQEVENIGVEEYKEKVYPYRWKVAPSRSFLITDELDIIISTMGVNGIALIKLQAL